MICNMASRTTKRGIYSNNFNLLGKDGKLSPLSGVDVWAFGGFTKSKYLSGRSQVSVHSARCHAETTSERKNSCKSLKYTF